MKPDKYCIQENYKYQRAYNGNIYCVLPKECRYKGDTISVQNKISLSVIRIESYPICNLEGLIENAKNKR